MKLDDPDHRRALHLLDLIQYHPAERRYAIEQLARSADMPSEGVAAMHEALDDTDVDVRRLVVSTLEKFGNAAVPALAAALQKDVDRHVREYAAVALGKIGPAAGEAVPALVAALNDVDLRWRASEALARLGLAGVPALAAALQGCDMGDRLPIVDVLRQLGPTAAQAVPALAATLQDNPLLLSDAGDPGPAELAIDG